MTWDGRRGNCRSRNYPAKANPNRAPIVQERANDFSGQGDSFPETCDPDCRRNPLTESQQRLAAKYLPMAEAMVLRLRCRDHERDELNSVAYMALVEAAQTFDPTRTVNFATFARLRIRGALQTYRKTCYREHPEYNGTQIPEYCKLEVLKERADWVFGEYRRSPEEPDLEEADALESYLRRLPQSQASACRLIYLEGRSQEEAAALLGYSKARLSRLHREALDRLSRECASGPSYQAHARGETWN